MNKDFWKRVNALEELAGKATQGEWTYDDVGNIIRIDPKRIYTIGFGGRSPNYKENAEYIAAANPAMIQEMIAEMRNMWGSLNWLIEDEKACGLLPEDTETSIENADAAWHLNRIKKSLGKRLKHYEGLCDFMRQEAEKDLAKIHQLEKEADWLAMKLEDNVPLLHEDSGWREAARKAL